MYDIKQAREVLKQKQLEDMTKRIAYLRHCRDVEMVDVLGLPYKVIKEQTKAYVDKGELPPNEYYPKHWTKLEDFAEWLSENRPDIMEIYNDNVKWSNFIFDMSKYEGKESIKLEEVQSDEYKALRKEYEESQKSFNNSTLEGIEKRKYYMARFLNGYDLTTFTAFDLLGVANADCKQAEVFRRELMELQADFEKDQQKYFTEKVLLPNDEKGV